MVEEDGLQRVEYPKHGSLSRVESGLAERRPETSSPVVEPVAHDVALLPVDRQQLAHHEAVREAPTAEVESDLGIRCRIVSDHHARLADGPPVSLESAHPDVSPRVGECQVGIVRTSKELVATRIRAVRVPVYLLPPVVLEESRLRSDVVCLQPKPTCPGFPGPIVQSLVVGGTEGHHGIASPAVRGGCPEKELEARSLPRRLILRFGKEAELRGEFAHQHAHPAGSRFLKPIRVDTDQLRGHVDPPVGLNHWVQARQVASAPESLDRLVCPRIQREDA